MMADNFAGFYDAVGAIPDEAGIADAFAARSDAARLREADNFIDQIARSGANPQAGGTDGISFGGIARDIGRGATEVDRQILGGARDAAQAAINGIGSLGDWLNENVADLDNLVLGRKAPKGQMPQLPEVKQATTTTGAVVRNVAQFLTGFAGAGGVIKAGGVAGAMAKGALADFAAFEPQQERLSNLINDHLPSLKNPVTEYLAADPADGQIEGRLKNAIEGTGLGVMAEGLFRSVRALRDARRAASEASPEQAAARAASAPREAQPLALLGDENAPLLRRGEAPPATPEKPPADLGVPGDVAARSLTAKGLTPLAERDGRGVYVNFARIDTADDVKRVIADTATAFKDEIELARRGVRSHSETVNAAGGVDAWQMLSDRRVGAALNAEETVAARRLWEASAAKLMDVADAAAGAPTTENLFQFQKMLAIHRTVQEQVIAARTEAARSLDAWKIPVGAGAERLRAIGDALGRSGGEAPAAALAERIAALKNIPNGMMALDYIAERSATGRTVDAIKELWINGLLSNVKTHIVNNMGNTAALAMNMVDRMAAAGVSRVIGSGEVLPGEAASLSFGLYEGIKDGLRLAAKSLRTGQSTFGTANVAVDYGARETRAISAGRFGLEDDSLLGRGADFFGFIFNLPTRFLRAEDDLFKSIAYRMEVNAQAHRQAQGEIARGLPPDLVKSRIADLIKNPPENIRLTAVDAATYQTFMSKPGIIVQGLNRFEGYLDEQLPVAALGFRMLIPFRNTIANLLKYSAEHSPAAPLVSHWREMYARGGADQDLALGRLGAGTMIMLGLTDMAFDGHLTGAGPSGKDSETRGTRDTLLRSGWQPYSIKIGDKYFDYRRTDPLGFSLGMAADIAEIANNTHLDADNAEKLYQAMAAAVFSLGYHATQKTYLSGLADFSEAMSEPKRLGAKFVDRLAASFVPAGVAEVRRQVDPTMRYASDLIDAVRNRTPGLSEDLPPMRDMWGRVRTFQSGMGQAYDAVSPLQARIYNPEPIDKEAILHDFNLAPPSQSLAFGGGKSISLRNRPEAYSRLLELRGQTPPGELGDSLAALRLQQRYGDAPLLQLLNDIVTGKDALSIEYQMRSDGRDGGKDLMIARIVADYGRAAKEKLLDEFPELAGIAEKRKEQKAVARGR